MKTNNKNKYAITLALIFSLFFIWAISSNLLPTMIRQLMKTFELSAFEASLTEASYWMAYFIFPIPIAMFMKRFSYKARVSMRLLFLSMYSQTVPHVRQISDTSNLLQANTNRKKLYDFCIELPVLPLSEADVF